MTIKDIATKTGLSIATVSLVLINKACRISAETRQRVLDVAAELNYRPNRLAVSLITKKTKTIGLVVPDISNMFFAELCKGAEQEAQRRGYNIILCCTNDNPDKDLEYANVLLDRNVDALVLAMAGNAAGNKAADCIKQSKDVGKPVVLLDRTFPEVETISVRIDHELGAYLATKHLLELGHVKIGCITGPAGLGTSQERFFGYLKALQEYGIPLDSGIVRAGDYHISSGYDLAKDLIDAGVSAIFACNDMMAYGVYKRAQEMQVPIPSRLSVVGFDNNFFSEIIDVPLTTIHQPVIELGTSAVETAIRLIKNPQAQTGDLVFKPELIVRSSTAPAYTPSMQ